MNSRDLVALGLPQECVGIAIDALKSNGLISKPAEATQRIGEIVAHPEGFADDPQFGELAKAVRAVRTQLEHAEATLGRNPHGVPSKFAQWGAQDDPGSSRSPH